MIVHRAAWSLAHSLWEGALIGVAAAIALKMLARRPAETRYAVSVVALIAILVGPVATFIFYEQAGSVLRAILQGFIDAIDAPAAIQSPLAAPFSDAWTRWVVLAWLVGVVASSVRFIVGWRVTRALVRTASAAVPSDLLALFELMRTQIRFRRPIRLLLSGGIDSPAAIGWLKPVVLLPLSAVTGLSPDQLRAVLAHELAHIRRHDFVVNVLQRGVESLLFYHPAVWWLSRRIRTEREHCCDDLAVKMCGDPLIYAEALVELERARLTAPPELAMTAARGIKGRVLRLLGRNTNEGDWREALAAITFVAALLVAGAWQSSTVQAQMPVLPVLLAPAPAEAGPAQILVSAIARLQPAASTAQLPQRQDSKASIEGVVVRAGSSVPVVGARVTATGGPTPVPSVTTDAQGRFVIKDLEAGSYGLLFAANGYVRQDYGQRLFQGPRGSVVLTAGQAMKDLVMSLTPAGNVSGRIRDDAGQPLAGIPVRLLRITYSIADGARSLSSVGTARTDDRGEYRIYWVAPGRYYLNAGGPTGLGAISMQGVAYNPNDALEGHAFTFYPSGSDFTAAKPLDVLPGVDLSGIDLNLRQTHVYHIRGRVVDARTGKAPLRAQVSVSARNPGDGSTYGTNSYDPATGRIDVGDLIPGTYRITVRLSENLSSGIGGGGGGGGGGAGCGPITNQGPSDSRTVTITDSDLDDVLMTLEDSLIVGRVQMEGPSPPSIPRLRVSLRSIGDDPNTRSYSSECTDNIAFLFRQVASGEYRLGASGVANSYVKEARFGGADVLNYPLKYSGSGSDTLNILLGSGVARIEGFVTDERLQRMSVVQVVVIPNRRDRFDLYKTTSTDSRGHFSLTNLAPGDYKVFAWEAIDPGSWLDPDLLRPFEQKGKPVHLAESGQETVDLRVISVGGSQ